MHQDIRRKDRAVTDEKQIQQILDQAKIVHLGLMDGDFPYIVPLHYGYEYDAPQGRIVLYMHCAHAGHKLDLIRQNPHACIEMETDVELSSGGDVPCQYGAFYASLIGRGHACILKDPTAKQHALTLLMRNQTGRTFDFTDQMAASVAVIQVELTSYTAKARTKDA